MVFSGMLIHDKVGNSVIEAGPGHLQLLECLLQEWERVDW